MPLPSWLTAGLALVASVANQPNSLFFFDFEVTDQANSGELINYISTTGWAGQSEQLDQYYYYSVPWLGLPSFV